jgi:hypothetical protein
MSELARAPSISDEARQKLDQARNNLDRIKAEEDSRKRRIQMRKDAEKSSRGQQGSAWWIKPLVVFTVICVTLIWIAWNWPTVQKFLA